MNAQPVPLAELLEATGAEVRGELMPDTVFRWVERDTRQMHPGDLYIAIRGERFDGHDFLPEADAAGALAALVRRSWADDHPGQTSLPLLVVDEPVEALQRLAAARRTKRDITVVGITGSIGKTSTKEVVAAVLGRRFATYKSAGNLNSEIGLPLCLLEMPPGTEVAVLEMGGAYAFGELALLASIARPQIAVVTNVHPVHLERMGTIENIAITKAELVESLPPGGTAVLNGDDLRVRAMAEKTPERVITFGLDRSNDIWADGVKTDGLRGSSFRLHLEGETLSVSIPLIGSHAVHLALSAIAVGSALGMHISEMLPGFEDPETQVRLLVTPGPRGAMLIDDTYNASTPSVMSALGLLSEMTPGRRIAVLGDMREMGAITEREHRLVGRRAAEVADVVVTYGDLAQVIADEVRVATEEDVEREVAVTSFGPEQRGPLLDYLLEELRDGDIVLLKGSRGLEMEEFVVALQQAAPETTQP